MNFNKLTLLPVLLSKTKKNTTIIIHNQEKTKKKSYDYKYLPFNNIIINDIMDWKDMQEAII